MMPPTMKFVSEMYHPNGKSESLYYSYFGSCVYSSIPCIVYPDGTVCISILVRNSLFKRFDAFAVGTNRQLQHPPGDDKYGYEKASERWSPVHTVETILISVISMLSSPNDESPANIEAAVSLLVQWMPSYLLIA